MRYTVNSLVYFPHDIFGGPINRLTIELIDNRWKITHGELVQTIGVPSAVQLNIQPQKLIKMMSKAESQRNVEVSIIVDTNDFRKAWTIASDVLETFCSWLTFLTLNAYKILNWVDCSTSDGHSIKISKSYVTPKDNSSIQTHTYNPAGHYDLSAWLTNKLPDEIIYPINCLRKGMIVEHLKEKVIAWATAMEGVSEILACQGAQIRKCPRCGEDLYSQPIASKDGLLNFLRNELGYSRRKIYDPIWKVRSKFIHADIKNIEYTYEQLTIIQNAAYALLVSVISYYILKQTDLPFKDKEQISGESYKYNHPFLGEVLSLKSNLEALANINEK
ncbi:hypothetical protein [Clostridium ljungdahlii]|uniref:Apea-like HEPN domain-containing protein n=1 Tax=Clostridium ljungdahlii TaxID=1538 RepID=A0A162L578_9CLOT|nr:hypothetical protein [Clostridium ljungdahlii]OAA91282.1 hypothetical protein WY13_00847 [Clostridium ljungdahlii]